MSDLICRRADKDDVTTILCIREPYSGGDYLPSYIEHFMACENAVNLVCQAGDDLVGYCCLFIIDNGEAYVLRAARVRKDMEGKGVMRLLVEYCRNEARTLGCRLQVSLSTSLNKHIFTQSYKESHKQTTKKIASRYLINQAAEGLLNRNTCTAVSEEVFKDILSNHRLRSCLFPEDRIMVDLVIFRLIEHNISTIFGKFTTFLFNATENEDGTVSGLMSAFSVFPVNGGRFHSIFDIYGSDVTSLQDHLMTMLASHSKEISQGLTTTIVVENEDLAKETRQILSTYGIYPVRWDEHMEQHCYYDYVTFESIL